jgi:hypothetical protein
MKRKTTLTTLVVFFACLSVSGLIFGGSGRTSATQPSQLSQPTLYCDGSTPKSIDIKFCAGATGAPAGFSIQWQTLADFQQHGWPADSDLPLDASGNPSCGASFCKASFSGVPGCAGAYSLGANGCVTVNIGDFLFDQCGASSTCASKALKCDTEYVFRAFAHNVPQGLGKSDFSTTVTCRTGACSAGTSGCTSPQGCWLLNGPEGCITGRTGGTDSNPWPQAILNNGMVIGGVQYTADQLCAIFHTTGVGDDGLPALAHQVIAARLNIASGADPTAAQAALDAADMLVNGKVIGVDSIPMSQTSPLTNTLRDYNEGKTGPGACVPCDPGADG